MNDQDIETVIHETAILERDTEIGAGTGIWHHCHIREGARIGKNSSLGKNVFVDAGVSIGSRVRIQNNVSVYAGVNVEDDVFVGPSAVFTNDRYPRSHNADWKPVPTYVRRGASVGANATIICGITLGEWSVVAAGAVVTKDVAPFQLVVGNPARHAGWVCRCGHVLNRSSASYPALQTCNECGETVALAQGQLS